MAQGIIRDGLQICTDCVVAIANDDYSGMSDELEAAIRAGITRLSAGGNWLVVGDELGFTNAGCDCCQDGLAGDAHELIVMGELAA